MYLEIHTNRQLKEETLNTLRTKGVEELQKIVRKYFGLDLQDGSELYILAPIMAFGVGEGEFVNWVFKDVFFGEDRNFRAAKEAVHDMLDAILKEYELEHGEIVSTRGIIPPVSLIQNEYEDIEPRFFYARRACNSG